MSHVIGLVILVILFAVCCGELIVRASRALRGEGKMGPTKCGRVHLGPVEEGGSALLKWQRCKACGCKINEVEQVTYWKTQRAAIKCRETALLNTRVVK